VTARRRCSGPTSFLCRKSSVGAANKNNCEAAKAELKSGDVLVRYGDTDLKSLEQLRAAIQDLATAKDGPKEISVKVWREGEPELMIRHVSPGRLGVGLSNEPAREAIASHRQSDAMLAKLRGDKWDDLPGTRAEITQIASLFGDRKHALFDSAASEQSLEELRQKGDLSKFRYLHFATHGKANDVKAFESVLILAQDTLPSDPLPRVDTTAAPSRGRLLRALRHVNSQTA
jgi:hypothetical protein